MKSRRFIFFPSFQPVFEYKILRTKKAMKKQVIVDVFDEHKVIYLFFRRPPSEFNSTSNLDTKRVSSYYGCRYQAVNLVDLLIHSSNIIDSTHSCRNSSNHLDMKRVSSYYGCRYQAVNLVDLLSRSSNIIDSTPACRNFSNKLDTKCISCC